MNRRQLIKTCTSLATLSLFSFTFLSARLSAQENTFKRYKRALLLDKNGNPISPDSIERGKQYIFFYPYRSTPAFLINLGKEVKPAVVKLSDGTTYEWKGGVGPKKSIVAFCAICPHQLSFPTPEYSFINYYPPDKRSKTAKRGNVIQCCAHMSVFDPERGGIVLDGPSEYPLLSIVLEESEGKLFAVGTLGVELFRDFFDAYRSELKKMYGSFRKAKKKVDKSVVLEVEEYVKEIIYC
ncbi:MAG: Rieske 2Fe-2S domain-containing protein [Aquificae bacterium]|nr:Rieske 2Fe-2S domain-containing protein [Aquificota bacterium]